MVHLLSAKATIDMCHQWVLLETEVGHCQNKINTYAIREIKVKKGITFIYSLTRWFQ